MDYYTKHLKLLNPKIAVTGHSSGLGKLIFENFDCVGFSRSNGHDIKSPEGRKAMIDASKGCEVFINCAFDLYGQIDLLFDLEKYFTGSAIVNISSNSGDGIKGTAHRYACIKSALDKASEQLYYSGKKKVINIRPGYIDTPRVSDIDELKLTSAEVIEAMCFTLCSDFRIKEVTFEK